MKYDTERYATFGRIMSVVAAGLDGEWSFENKDADGDPCHYGKLMRADNLTIGCYYGAYRGKISCSPCLPRGNGHRATTLRDVLPYDRRGSAEINAKVSLDLPADSIRSDLKRRVIDPYDKLYPEVLAYFQARQDNSDKLAAKVKETQAAFPYLALNLSKVRNSALEVTLYGNYKRKLMRKVTLHAGDYATLELSSIPFDRLEAVLRALEIDPA